MLRMQIDLANVKAALDCVRHRMHGESVPDFRALAGGKLAPAVFKALGQAASMVEAFEALEASYFAAGIEKGILAFGLAGNLGVKPGGADRAGSPRADPLYRGAASFVAATASSEPAGCAGTGHRDPEELAYRGAGRAGAALGFARPWRCCRWDPAARLGCGR
jgi:hypothetical protein